MFRYSLADQMFHVKHYIIYLLLVTYADMNYNISVAVQHFSVTHSVKYLLSSYI